jgi:hypothetical protein
MLALSPNSDLYDLKFSEFKLTDPVAVLGVETEIPPLFLSLFA